MKNAAGDVNCDVYIRQELEAANIPVTEMEILRSKGEVPSAIIGILDGWTFRRAWYYWVAQSDRSVLLFNFADPLHEKYSEAVRVDGHCGCPAPREYLKEPWCIGVNLYHVDSQEGLIALADAIRSQTASNIACTGRLSSVRVQR
mgnify:FL=1